jgi:hypothetical protein
MAPARPHRVLVLTADKVGASMAGPAIRSVELAGALAGSPDADSTVTLASSHPVDREVPGVRTARYGNEADLRRLVDDADVVLAMAGLLHEHPWIGEPGASGDGPGAHVPAVIVDAYDPVLFEVLELFAGRDRSTREATAADATARMVEPLRRADLVLVASDRQRHLVIGMLTALGRVGVDTYDADPTLDRLVAVVPFGLPEAAPDAGGRHPLKGDDGPFGPDDFVLFWGGGLYQWLDPVTLVEGVAALGDPSVKAFLLAGPHPTPEVPAMEMAQRARRRAEELGVAGSQVVFGEDWIPYDERAAWLLDADVSVSLHRPHLETTFAFRTRLLDSLWAGLPIVCSDGDSLADLVDREGLGVVVPPGDVDALAAAIVRLRDPHCYADARRALHRMAPSYTWARVAAPIVEFCRRPTISPDRAARGPARSEPLSARVARSGRTLARRGRDLVRRGSAALDGSRSRHREQP